MIKTANVGSLSSALLALEVQSAFNSFEQTKRSEKSMKKTFGKQSEAVKVTEFAYTCR